MSFICLTFGIQSAAYVWHSGPSQLHTYDLQGPISFILWPSRPSELQRQSNRSLTSLILRLKPRNVWFYVEKEIQEGKRNEGKSGIKATWLKRGKLAVSVSASIVCFLYRPLPYVSCIGLYCRFPVSAYIVCFLYRPILSVSCIGLYCLFPVSAYTVCFLYRPLWSVCCGRAVGMFTDIANTTGAKCQREGVLFYQHWRQACALLHGAWHIYNCYTCLL